MATKAEIQAMMIDAIKREMGLFGIYSLNDFPGNVNKIWTDYYSETDQRTGGNRSSSVSYEQMQELKAFYDSATENDLTAFNNLLTIIVGDTKSATNSQNNVISALIDEINANTTWSDEQKQLMIDSVIRGYSEGQRLVPKLDTSDPSQTDRYVYENGVIVEDLFGGHFGAGMEGVYEQALNPESIIAFQELLEDEGIVPKGTFDDTKGQKSSKLRTELAKLMLWIDMNEYAVYGTNDYNLVMQQDLQKGGGVFSHASYLQGENLFHQKLLNYFVGDYVQDMKQNANVNNRIATEERLAKFLEQAPGPIEMEGIVESAYYSLMQRRGTQSEIDEFGKKLAGNYVDYFNDLNAMYNQIANVQMIAAPNMGWEVPADQVEGLFVDSPEFTFREQFQEENQPEISLAVRAANKRSQQEAMLNAMFG